MDDWLKDLIERETGAIYYSKTNTTNTVPESHQEPLTTEKIKKVMEDLEAQMPKYDNYVLMDDGSVYGYKKPYMEGSFLYDRKWESGD